MRPDPTGHCAEVGSCNVIQFTASSDHPAKNGLEDKGQEQDWTAGWEAAMRSRQEAGIADT